MSSEMLREYTCKRLDEMISEDKECMSINKQLLDIEKEIMPVLSSELEKKFLKIDRLNFELINRICFLVVANFEQNEQFLSKISSGSFT